MKITEHNVGTGEVIFRDATDEEVKAISLSESETALRIAEQKFNAEKRAKLFEKLGITEEEAKLLLS
jgi:hypothetical protein